MIYMYAIPRALDRYRDLKLRGQMTYQDHTVHIPAEAADDQFVQNLGTLIRRLADEKPATRVPSRPETASRCARAAEGSVLTQRQRRMPYEPAKRLCVAPAQEFGAFTCICHRPYGRRWETERYPRPDGAGKRRPTT